MRSRVRSAFMLAQSGAVAQRLVVWLSSLTAAQQRDALSVILREMRARGQGQGEGRRGGLASRSAVARRRAEARMLQVRHYMVERKIVAGQAIAIK